MTMPAPAAPPHTDPAMRAILSRRIRIPSALTVTGSPIAMPFTVTVSVYTPSDDGENVNVCSRDASLPFTNHTTSVSGEAYVSVFTPSTSVSLPMRETAPSSPGRTDSVTAEFSAVGTKYSASMTTVRRVMTVTSSGAYTVSSTVTPSMSRASRLTVTRSP